MALAWAKNHENAYTKEGKFNNQAAYGILGTEVTSMLYQLQFSEDKNIIVVGALDRHMDKDTKAVSFEPRLEGQKSVNEIVGVFDEIISMVEMKGKDGQSYRVFVCDRINKWNYPAKTRGNLNQVEVASLKHIFEKIKANRTKKRKLTYAIPSEFI